jgi:hypothetical protein
MTSSERRSKKIIIASVYITILVSIIFIIVLIFLPRQPIVVIDSPNIQPIQIVRFGEIQVDSLNSDFWVELNNPNDEFGASNLGYTFIFKNSQGQEEFKTGRTFILPGDKKRYVLMLNLDSRYELIDFKLNQEVSWTKLSRSNLPELVIRNVNLGISSKAGNYFTAFGILTNSSTVNLKNIQVIAILTDDSDNILGVNETLIRDVLTSESRDFEMIWKSEISNTSTSNTTIYAQSNVLNDSELLLQLQRSPVFDE